MTPTFQHDCPYCRTKKCLFTGVASSKVQQTIEQVDVDALFKCANCHRHILVGFISHNCSHININNIDGSIANQSEVSITSVYPEPRPVDIPEHVPERVSSLFLEAEQNLSDQRYESAVAAYRKALEIALKTYTPEIEAFKLEKRIDKLHQQGKITDSLKDWAHEIRLIGNDGLHDLDQPDPAEVQQMALLTRYLFVYLYTLPEKVNRSRAGQ